MANEITVTNQVRINNGNLQEFGQPASFRMNMDSVQGPTPGFVTVPTTGVDLDLSALSSFGVCRIRNLDETNDIIYGIKEPSSGFFYPIGKVRPGHHWWIDLADELLQEFTNTGTGTSAATNKFHIRAKNAACKAIVDAYGK